MRQRFTYSRWDGTQKGFDLDADAILSEITDDLLYHGDISAALRRLMRSGMTDADGNRIEGLSEMLERIRERRQTSCWPPPAVAAAAAAAGLASSPPQVA